jgi:TolB-like protein/Flp pilus assembly protein TadD
VSGLLAEIRRRKVVQTFVPYLGFVWLVLQVVSVITPMLNWSPLVNTFVAVLLFAGMPVMLYLSWYFDFTSEGLVAIPDKKTNEVSAFGPVRWSVLLIITLGSGLLGYRYYADVEVEFAKSQDGIQNIFIADSIAVLPFKDASADQDQDFLAQGLAEEITSLLGRTAGLKVAASSSTRLLADKGLDPVAVARRLNVSTVLTGSVRVSGDQLKIRVELLNASDAKVLWSETFARKFNDIFNVESEIARSTVNMLQDTYIESGTLTNSASTKSTDAYVIYLNGREQYRKQTTEAMKEARKLFEQAVGLDPEYVQAYVGLADTILMLAKGETRFGVLDVEVANKLAEQYLEKVFVRNADLDYAYALRGKILERRNEPDEALAAYDKAISLNPSLAIAYMWRYLVLKRAERFTESLASLEVANRLDPLSVANIYNLGFEYKIRGEAEEAKSQYQLLINEYPALPMGYAGLADLAFVQGNYAQSLQYWAQAKNISPENQSFEDNYNDVILALNLGDSLSDKIKNNPNYKNTYLLQAGKYEALFEQIQFELLANPDDQWLKFEAAWYEALVGDGAKAHLLFGELRDKFVPAELYSMPYCSPAIEIAWADLSLTPESGNALLAKCAQLADIAKQSEIRSNTLFYLQARIASLQGKKELAIDLLDQAIAAGWTEWWTELDPLLLNIKQEPRTQALLKKLESKLAEQRQLALPMLTSEQQD